MGGGWYYYHFAVEFYPMLKMREYKMRVDVLEEKGNRFKVRYKDFHENGKDGPGSDHWVQKRKVVLDAPLPIEPKEINNRNPYKD